MKFAFYNSLKPGAQKALKRGTGNYRKYVVDGQHLAVKDKNGRAMDWILIVPNNGPAIKGIPA